MDQQLQWLKDEIGEVKSDVKNINTKVDEMLAFKWQIISGGIVASTFITLMIQGVTIWLTYKSQ